MNEGNFFTAIPSRLLVDKKLSSDEKVLLGQIYMLSNQRGFCWATNTYFANLNSVTVRSIQKWIKNLEENNYIIVETIRETEIANRPIRALIIAEATAPEMIKKLKERTREIEQEKAKKEKPSSNMGEPGFTPMGEPGFTSMGEPEFTHNKYNINNNNYNKRACARDTTRAKKSQASKTQFHQFNQRDYDLNNLEKAILKDFYNPTKGAGG